MVHALSEVHRVLAPGGILVDARPDSRVPAYAERHTKRGSQRFGVVSTSRFELANDRAADEAVARLIAERLFRTRRRGRFWHPVPFDNLAALRRYLWEHQRFVHRARWVVDEATRRSYADEKFVIRRAVRFELLESLPRLAATGRSRRSSTSPKRSSPSRSRSGWREGPRTSG